MEQSVKINGFDFKVYNANAWTDQQGVVHSTKYVRAKDVATVARQICKLCKVKARVTTSSTGSINIRPAFDTSNEKVAQVKRLTSFLEGSSFDGMIDLESYNDHRSDNGERVSLGSRFVFVQKDWR